MRGSLEKYARAAVDDVPRSEDPLGASGSCRRRVFACVEEHQGAHLRDLVRRSAIPLGTILHHLNRLEAAGLVVGRRDFGFKRYFAGRSLGIAQKEILSALRRTTPRRIAVVLVETRAATQAELRLRIGASRSTMSFHVNDLVQRRILRSERWGTTSRYLLENADITAQLLLKYGASLGVLPQVGLRGAAPVWVAGEA